MLARGAFVLLFAVCVAHAARLPRDTETEVELSPDPNPTPAVDPVVDTETEVVQEEPQEPAPVSESTPESKPEVKEPKEIKEGKDKNEAKTKASIYTSRFDSIDLDQILRSDRLLNNYFKCLMETGRCTPDAAELRRLLPDALETECSKCTEKQKQGSERVIEHMIKNKPEQWKQLQAKYDPKGNYKSKYQHLAEEKGLKVE